MLDFGIGLFPLLLLIGVLVGVVFVFRLKRRGKAAQSQPAAKPAQATAVSKSKAAAKSGRVFINYRREDTAGFARALCNDLARRFDQSHVFMDVDSIEPGVDFVEAIEKAVGDCDVVLVLIGQNWLQPRLQEPEDVVRIEIATALGRDGIRVIPVLVEDAEMPRGDQLPDALAPLARRHAAKLSHARFQADVDKLAEIIAPAIGGAAG